MDYETVTLKIPKALMKFLREQEDMLEEKVEDYLQSCVVGSVRAAWKAEKRLCLHR